VWPRGSADDADGTDANLFPGQTRKASSPMSLRFRSLRASPHRRQQSYIRSNFFDLAAKTLQDELLGSRLYSSEIRSSIEGLLYYVLSSSDTLEALRRVVRYSTIVNEGIALKSTVLGSRDVRTGIRIASIRDRHLVILAALL
jgi:hypothetical protein